MDLPHLRACLALADSADPSAAARRLRIPRAQLLRAIAELEQELGLTLFVGKVLTPEGREFVTRARDAVNACDEAIAHASALARAERSALRVRVAAAGAWDIASKLVAAHGQPAPELEGSGGVEDVVKGRADLAVTTERPADHGLDGRVIGHLQLFVALSRNHPLAGRKRVPFTDIAHEKVILPFEFRAPWVHAAWYKLRERHGMMTTPVEQSPLSASLLRAVHRGAFALLPEPARLDLPGAPHVELRPLEPTGSTPVWLVWHPKRDCESIRRFREAATSSPVAGRRSPVACSP